MSHLHIVRDHPGGCGRLVTKACFTAERTHGSDSCPMHASNREPARPTCATAEHRKPAASSSMHGCLCTASCPRAHAGGACAPHAREVAAPSVLNTVDASVALSTGDVRRGSGLDQTRANSSTWSLKGSSTVWTPTTPVLDLPGTREGSVSVCRRGVGRERCRGADTGGCPADAPGPSGVHAQPIITRAGFLDP